MESIQQTWNGEVAADARCSATISRNGDLIHKMYVQMTSGNINAMFNPGACLLKEVELEIGGQRIDKHYGHWLETWAELNESTGGINGIDGTGYAADVGAALYSFASYTNSITGGKSVILGGNGFQKCRVWGAFTPLLV